MLCIYYDNRKEFNSISPWIFYAWSCLNRFGVDEWGVRIFGVVLSNFIEPLKEPNYDN